MFVGRFSSAINCCFHSCCAQKFCLATTRLTWTSGDCFWQVHKVILQLKTTLLTGYRTSSGPICTSNSTAWTNYQHSRASRSTSRASTKNSRRSSTPKNHTKSRCLVIGTPNWIHSKSFSFWRQFDQTKSPWPCRTSSLKKLGSNSLSRRCSSFTRAT